MKSSVKNQSSNKAYKLKKLIKQKDKLTPCQINELSGDMTEASLILSFNKDPRYIFRNKKRIKTGLLKQFYSCLLSLNDDELNYMADGISETAISTTEIKG